MPDEPMEQDCPYAFLEAEMWRMLLGRAAIFRAVRARLGELEDAARDRRRYGTSVHTALNHLYEAVETVASGALNSQQAVAEVAESWLIELRRIAAGKTVKPNARKLLNDLHSLTRHTSAHDPFRELLEKVEVQASAVYNSYWREVSLSLDHVAEHPRQANRDPYALTAATTIVRHQATIELTICPLEFGPAAYAALPFIFIHESVCHVPARQDKDNNHSAFAEGFLDWAAVHFFEQWMARIDADLTPAAIQHGAHLGEILKDGENPAWAQRTYGHRRANVLATWFQTEIHRCSAEEARAKVTRLAVELNCTDKPLALKDRFVSRLNLPFSMALRRRLLAWEAGDAAAGDLLGDDSESDEDPPDNDPA